jgi:translation initiation factor IF-3
MSLRQALQLAQEHDLDLVEVAPTASPPVCRLLDYGKYKYEQAKKERRAKKSQKIGLLKELRLRPKIEEHDLQAKIRTARKLLEEGSKIRVVMRFRGREVVYPELGWKVLQNLTEALKEIAVVSDHPVKMGNVIVLTLSPLSSKLAAKVQKKVTPDAKTQDAQRG